MHSGEALIEHEERVTDHGTGKPGWSLTSKVQLRDDNGKILGLLGIGFDITERKAMEAQFVQRNAELTELNQKLSQAHEQILQSEKLAALGALVGGLAHELNTPIGNGMMAASTLALQTSLFASDYATGLKRATLETFIEDASHASDILMRNLMRASDLVASFKQVAVDQTSSQRRMFSVAEVVGELMLTMSPTIKKKPISVIQTVAPDLNMDSYPGPFGQVLINLINNALLHAFDGRDSGTITIHGQAIGDDMLELSVSDDGLGILDTHLHHIFDPFFTTKLGMGNSGLGLSITHNIVTGILGGAIRVKSTPNLGASFILTLPLVAPHKAHDENALIHC